MDTTNNPTGTIAIAYLDPHNVDNYCTAANSSTTGGYSGCQKWYVYSYSSSTGKYSMLMAGTIGSETKYFFTSDSTTGVEEYLNNFSNQCDSRISVKMPSAYLITDKIGIKKPSSPGSSNAVSWTGYEWLRGYYWTSSTRDEREPTSNGNSIYVISDNSIYLKTSSDKSTFYVKPIITVPDTLFSN